MACRSTRLALLLVVCASTCSCGPSRPAPRVVPWVDRPLPLYVAPIPRPRPYRASARPCRAEQLRVTQGRFAVATGNDLEELVFHNSGPTCLLRGYPRVSGLDSSGARRMLPARRGGTFFGELVPADMPPDGRTLLDFGTGRACDVGTGTGTRYRDLIFVLPGGGLLRGGTGVAITEFCGLSLSTFGLHPPPLRDPVPRPGTAGTLTASVTAPASVAAGGTLRYTVTLTNPTRRRVRLIPCPGYTQGLYAEGLVTRGSFALDCDRVRAIEPHRRVRFAMRLRVPNRAAPSAKLGWSLNDPNGPLAAAIVEVTRPAAGATDLGTPVTTGWGYQLAWRTRG